MIRICVPCVLSWQISPLTRYVEWVLEVRSGRYENVLPRRGTRLQDKVRQGRKPQSESTVFSRIVGISSFAGSPFKQMASNGFQ